jgi:hypothetical protein
MGETLPKDDLLDGVADYVAFLGANRFNKRRVFYLLEKGLLPGGKIGRRWIGSKARVRERLAQLTAGEAA